MSTKQHWRALTDSKSDAFTAADLFALTEGKPTSELVVRIDSATGGAVTDFDTNKKIRKVMVKFAAVEKPLGMNVTNCRAMETLTGSPFPSDWTGVAVTIYVGKAERGRRKGDPEGTPSKVTVDAVRIKVAKPDQNAPVHGVAAAVPFDLDGWRATFAGCKTVADLDQARKDLNAAKPPKAHHADLATIVEAARVRVTGGAA